MTIAPQIGKQAAFYYGRARDLLIATTALVATAGVAAADVTLSGFGRVGASYVEDRFNDANGSRAFDAGDNLEKETQVDHRLRLNVVGTAESDGGLSFSATLRIQADDVATTVNDTFQAQPAAFFAPAYRISYEGLTIGVGNVSLAEETAGFAAGSLGYTGFMFANPRAFDGLIVTPGLWNAATDGQVMVTYTAAGFTVGAATSDSAAGVMRNVFSAAYAFGDYTASVTIQDSDNRNQDYTSVYFGGAILGINFGLYADDFKNGTSAYGATATMTVAQGLTATLTANTLDNRVAGDTDESYGVGLNYDLGGGVSLGGGIASIRGVNNAEVGVVFNF